MRYAAATFDMPLQSPRTALARHFRMYCFSRSGVVMAVCLAETQGQRPGPLDVPIATGT